MPAVLTYEPTAHVVHPAHVAAFGKALYVPLAQAEQTRSLTFEGSPDTYVPGAQVVHATHARAFVPASCSRHCPSGQVPLPPAPDVPVPPEVVVDEPDDPLDDVPGSKSDAFPPSVEESSDALPDDPQPVSTMAVAMVSSSRPRA